MDVREKLVELLVKASHECDDFYDLWDMRQAADDSADFLIAHGVTVQEWISQAELPWMGEEIAKLCIRYMEEYADFHGYASSKKVKDHIVRLLELEKDGRIAILPQPSKGERS
jgi:hypothetical protein